jgi:hypothetical protein
LGSRRSTSTADGVGLDAVGLAVQHRLDDEAQESAKLRANGLNTSLPVIR